MGENKRREFTAAFKSKVALERLKGDRTIAEMASTYEVHPNQIMQWKKQAVELLKDGFSNKRGRKSNNAPIENHDDMLRLIGKLEVENEFLKKSTLRC